MKKSLPLFLAVFLVSGGVAIAQEHPEHPKGNQPAAKKMSMDDLEKAIKRDVAAEEKKNGGYIKVEDSVDKKTWDLKLDKVHRERLSQLDANTYFACSDFKSKDGHLVDVDFFEKEKDGKLVMTDRTIHKVDGKARYNWEEKDGYWKRVAVK